MLWRQKVKPGRVKGSWVGPLRVILTEGSTVWLATGATLVRAKMNQIRQVTKREETGCYSRRNSSHFVHQWRWKLSSGISKGGTIWMCRVMFQVKGKFEKISPRQRLPFQLHLRRDRTLGFLKKMEIRGHWWGFIDFRGWLCLLRAGWLSARCPWKSSPESALHWFATLMEEMRWRLRTIGVWQEACKIDGQARHTLTWWRERGRRSRGRSAPMQGMKRKGRARGWGSWGEDRRGAYRVSLWSRRLLVEPCKRLYDNTDQMQWMDCYHQHLQCWLKVLQLQINVRFPGCNLPGGHYGAHQGDQGRFLYDLYEGKKWLVDGDDDQPQHGLPAQDDSSSDTSSSSEELLPEAKDDVVLTQEEEETFLVCEMDLNEKDLEWLAKHPKERKVNVWLSKKMSEKGKEVVWNQLPIAKKKEFDLAQAKELTQVAVSQALRRLTKEEELKLNWNSVMQMRWVLTLKGDQQTAKARLVVLGFQATKFDLGRDCIPDNESGGAKPHLGGGIYVGPQSEGRRR